MSLAVVAALVGVLYVGALLALAFLGDAASRRGRNLADNPWVYCLSLTVYCTSMTFFGSVGQAATEGLGFLPIYLGPTLMFLLAPTGLRRLVAFCRRQGITSVPDLLETLYGKGVALGALGAILLIGSGIPYVALQLKAVGHSFDLLAGRAPASDIAADPALWAALALGLFSVLFGARTFAATQRHSGLVLAVAAEGVVKLGITLALGAYAVWGVGGGIASIFERALARPEFARLLTLGEGGTSVVEWTTLGTLCGGAVLLLPRQFQMLAVENLRDEHVAPAAWAFPGYLLLTNLLVLPVALVGLLEAVPGDPDFFLLSIPLARGNGALALLAYLGGLSAAASMVIVTSAGLSTTAIHYLLAPLVLRFRPGRDVSRLLLQASRASIFGVVLLGYAYHRWVGTAESLVEIGLFSFAAVAQFAPAVFHGLLGRGRSRAGALAGLAGGLAVWLHTLVLPRLVLAGWLDASLLEAGPWGLPWLRPQALFNLEGLDPWTHSLVWSLVFNGGLFGLVSLLTAGRREAAERDPLRGAWISRKDVEGVLERFLGAAEARRALEDFPADSPTPALLEAAERSLAGALGTTSAKVVLRSLAAWRAEGAGEILDVFGGVTRTLAESREALERRLRELSVLHEASRALSQSLDCDTLLAEVLHLIQREFGFDHLAVRLLDADGNLSIRSRLGLTADYVAISAAPPSRDTYFGQCFLDGRPVAVGDTRGIPETRFLKLLAREVPVGAFLHAPMVHEGKPIGVLTAYGTRGPVRFTPEFVDLFAALANQLALSVMNAQLYGEVQEYSREMEEKVRRRTAELEAANERLRELDRLKTDFLSTVSHELRTPLTSIRSFSEILLRYDVEDLDKRRRFVRIIHDEAERLTRMINQLLDLAKIEAGRMEFDLRPLEAAEALGQAAEATRPLFAEKGVAVDLDTEAGLPPVLADRDRLQQVLVNLLSNAAKFSPPGSRVVLAARRRGGLAEVSVVDQGAGIPDARLTEVFERFTQIRDPGQHHPLGTGLGLTIARDIVERMGGEIRVESALGRGTTFSFTLPLAGEADAPARSPS